MHLLQFVTAKNKMLGFILFTLIKYNLLVQEKKFEQLIFDLHVKYELRLQDDRESVSLTTFINEYREAKYNNFPPLSSAYHFGFPHKCITREILIFNQNYQSYCKFRMENGSVSDSDYFGNALTESKELYKVYDALDDALTNEFSLFRRRKALRIMVFHLGEEDFYKGILPPFVPIWRFDIPD